MELDATTTQIPGRTSLERGAAARWIGERSRLMLALRGVDDYCGVDVEQHGDALVFWGQVDSPTTRERVLALAHVTGRYPRVIDNLVVLAPEVAYREQLRAATGS